MKFTFLSLILLLVSCRSPKGVIVPEGPREVVEYNDLGYGELFGAGQEGIEEGYMVIKNEIGWLMLKAQMDSINPASNRIESSIDYESDDMFVYFDKVRSTGGYVLSVTSVMKGPKSLDISVEIKKPDGPAATVLTQPFVAISYPKSDLPVAVTISEQ
jgi:hypothetical protein